MSFYKMTVFIFLLLFFIKLCFSSPFSDDFKSLSYKRDYDNADNDSTTARIMRYTRWSGGTVLASAEFLVQVFDEDPPASSSSPAPELIRFEERLGKMQLGSVMMPSRTTLTTPAVTEPAEYTRFMPPKGKVLRVGETLDENHSITNYVIHYPRLTPKTPKTLIYPQKETAPIHEDRKINKELVMTKDDGEVDEDAAMIKIDNVLRDMKTKAQMRAMQYTAVPVSAREQHAKLSNHLKSARMPTVKSIVLAPLRSTKLFPKKTSKFTDSLASKEQVKFKFIHSSTRLHRPAHSTRLDNESDDNGVNENEIVDYEDTDKGDNVPDTEPGDYDESNYEEVYNDKIRKTPTVPNDKPSTRSSTVLIWEDDETEEKSITHSSKSDADKSTSSIRSSTKIYWGIYDDYSDEDSTKTKLTKSTNLPKSTKSPKSSKSPTKNTNLTKPTKGINPTASQDQIETEAESHSNAAEAVDDLDDTTTIKDSEIHFSTASADDSSDYGEIINPPHTPDDDQHILTNTMGTRKTQHTSQTTKLSSIPTTTFTYPSIKYPIPHGDCKIFQENPFTFISHHKLVEIMSQLAKWGESPVAKLVDISKGNQTYMLNSIQMIIVDDRSHGQDSMAKQTVLIVAGLQGRDHNAVSAAMYLLFELIERSKHHMDLLSQYRFWIIPVFNPDGYDYSTSFSDVRNWKKNLRQSWEKRESCQKHGIHCVLKDCMGVHLDRNFEYQWISGMEAHAVHPCGDLYPGERQLSEPETAALARHLYVATDAVFTFVALKEGEVRGVLYPYSHTKNNRASDSVHRMRAGNAAAAAKSIAGRKFVHGQASEFLPLYAGGIEDWMEGHHGVDNSYTIMLDQPAENVTIETLSQEVFAAVDTILLTKSPPLKLMFNAPQDSAGEARRPPGWLWLRRCGALTATTPLTHTSVICLHFVFSFMVTSILRVVGSMP